MKDSMFACSFVPARALTVRKWVGSCDPGVPPASNNILGSHLGKRRSSSSASSSQRLTYQVRH